MVEARDDRVWPMTLGAIFSNGIPLSDQVICLMRQAFITNAKDLHPIRHFKVQRVNLSRLARQSWLLGVITCVMFIGEGGAWYTFTWTERTMRIQLFLHSSGQLFVEISLPLVEQSGRDQQRPWLLAAFPLQLLHFEDAVDTARTFDNNQFVDSSTKHEANISARYP